MNKKISLGLALTLVFASITATFSVTMLVSRRIYNGLIADLASRVEMYSAIEDINALVRTNYYYYRSIKSSQINLNISKGYIEGLADGHNRFLTAAEYIEYERRLLGNASGVGLTASWDSQNGTLTVTSVAPGSSASARGIKEKDVITKIDNENVNSRNYAELLKRLEGDNLTTVDVTCRQDGELKEFKVTIGYSYVSVSHKTIGELGYVRISAFYANTRDQLRRAVEDLRESGVKGVIFDLRNTSEGGVEYAAAAADCITPLCARETDVLVSLIDRDGSVAYSHASSSSDLILPMTVLVNKRTGGPAELFACVLRDFEKASLIGAGTSGNGTSQKAHKLADGNAVILTVAKIRPYRSESFDTVGLIPDFEVALPDETEARLEHLEVDEDLQLQKAIAELLK
ncbi:MAG: S41 family peptidase [Oscillospiraceae bacterium]|nr:S41 family peptidase [Oscillospiraceae bacterium]